MYNNTSVGIEKYGKDNFRIHRNIGKWVTNTKGAPKHELLSDFDKTLYLLCLLYHFYCSVWEHRSEPVAGDASPRGCLYRWHGPGQTARTNPARRETCLSGESRRDHRSNHSGNYSYIHITIPEIYAAAYWLLPNPTSVSHNTELCCIRLPYNTSALFSS